MPCALTIDSAATSSSNSAPTGAAPGRGNLTGRQSQLVGRDDDTRRLIEELEAHDLVTITGVGGVGKTSLARSVALHLADDTTEVWYIELAPLSDPADVLATIVTTVGVTATVSTPRDLAKLLARRGEIVLVLDNCEHVIDGIAEIADALIAEPNLRILTTSRLQIGSHHEQVVRLAPLVHSKDAVDLFIRQARLRDPTFTSANGRRDVIVAICEQLSGIPLAIELAAARTGSLGLGEIYDQLSQLLDSRPSRAGGDPRHDTMTAAIAWSTDILRPDATDGLGVLSVLAGTFDLKAAAALLDLVTDRPAFDVIDELVSHSLVEPIRIERGLRYRILEPVRQHAANTLLVDPDRARHRHLEHFLDTLEDAHRMLTTTSSAPIVDILRHDLDNLRAVHDWALESGRIDDDLRLYRPLMFSVWHDVYEPGDWALETLSVPAIEEHGRWREALASAFQSAGHRSGQAFDERSEDLYRRVECAGPGPGDDLLGIMQAWIVGSYRDHWREAVARYDAVDTDDPAAMFCRWLICPIGRTIAAHGDIDVGLREQQAGLVWARSIGATNFEAGILSEVAHIHQMFGDRQAAVDAADRCVALAARNRMRHIQAQAVLYRAQSVRRGATSESSAFGDIRWALDSAVQAGSGARTIYTLRAAAQILADARRFDAAALAGAGSEPVSHWPQNDLDRVPVDARRRAGNRIREASLDLFEIGALTLSELDALGDIGGAEDTVAAL